MRTKKTMCTWQILSNSPNNFHWQRITTTTTHQHASPPSFPLPSMQDLLRQGTPTLPLQDDAVARGEERVLDDGFGFSNSLFTTGSGKKVTISSSGLVRAKTLLDTIDSSIQSPHRTNKLHAIGEKRKQRQEEEDESPQLKLHRVIDSPSVGGGCRALKKNGFEETDAYKQAPIKFHTAGGRSISISKDALQRAQSLLGDVGDLFEGGDAGSSMFSFPFERQADTAASSQRGDCNTPLVRRVLTPARSNCTAKSFTFPLQSSRQRELPPKFPCEGDGNNLITEFDAVGEESGYNSLKSTNACGQKKPLYGWNQAPHSAVHDSSLNGFSSKIDTHAVSIRRPLVDVSNTTNPDQTNNRQPASGKRRLGLRVTVSPFKKPRSSQISVPLEQDIGKSPHAGLCGWNGPVSPLEVSSTVSLLLHINGTYRAHWAERLGFCKIAGPPLAFRCIKSNGGLVPQTLAGITRIYPILYMERLSSGRSVVMSERMENKMMELYNQRRSAVVDGIISEYQKERPHIYYDSDSEGAKIYNMLETAEEPEFLMADMSPEQLNSFATYKAKLNAIRQSEMDKSIEKALKDAGLGSRQVTPFMRLRVVGLTYKTRQDKPKEGIVAIWNPTETQRQELVEGGAYAISGLMPSSSDSDILHLDTRGSSTKWLPLSYNSRKQFKPFFCNRKSIPLTSLGDIPLSNEFDITAYVVHVGGVYISNQQKKQWVFATDGSIMNGLQSEKLIDSLLAICFCSPLIDHDSFPPINYNLAGSTVGFCNLIKKEKDHTNHIWVADANENSAYYLNFDSTNCSHLRNAASSVRAWANHSSLIIEKLKEKVMYVVGEDCKA
ncbi:Breast cancer type 2 susceptibility protein like [Glycine soja]|uniref:Breast cancer type 2 susceptibility protein like n=1 Tax=Glycine soja TaxID=3848 RepID=A0A0B2RZP5_GLYSO|nr:Breast cancer type 2 susceptibility protein like [Glycine soja]